VERLFGQGGKLEAILAGYEPRSEQAELAQAVARALSGKEHLLAEAGTGTGKSLAYLLPALSSGKRVVVSTATKALQEQLLEKDVPVAAVALGREARVAVLKGRQNYVCRRALAGYELLGGALFPRPEEAQAFEALRPWLASTDTGDRSELPFEPPQAVWAEIAVGSDQCLGRRCPFLASCFSEEARRRAQETDLVVVNHALYFADLAVRERKEGARILPEHEAVIFDEAHRLEEAATTWLGGRISLGGLRRLARDVERACREGGRPAPGRAIERLQEAGQALIVAVAPSEGRARLRQPPLALAQTLSERLVALAEALQGGGEELDALARRALHAAGDVESWARGDDDERVAWAEPDALVWAPVDVSRTLRERLWKAGPTAILVSATLASAGDFSFVCDRLGLRGVQELAVGSPFSFREQVLLYVPEDMPDPREPNALRRVAEEAALLCQLSRGRALVLTSSYRALRAVADRMRATIAYELLVQGEAPRERLLERFRERVHSVLVATGTFWQGVDIPGESLSLLVIDKLPFQAPGDPLVEARCERIAARGGDPFREYLLPRAVLQLRQGFGRLIRSRADRGVVALLDPRVHARPYGRVFLASLPPCRLTSERAQVAAFLAEGRVGA